MDESTAKGRGPMTHEERVAMTKDYYGKPAGSSALGKAMAGVMTSAATRGNIDLEGVERDIAPAGGIPLTPKIKAVRGGGSDPSYPVRRPIGRSNARPTLPVTKTPVAGEGNDPSGMARPCTCEGPNCTCG